MGGRQSATRVLARKRMLTGACPMEADTQFQKRTASVLQ